MNKDEINRSALANLGMLRRAVVHDAVFEYSQPRLFNLLTQKNTRPELIIEFINAAEPVFKSVMGVSPLIWDEYIQSLELATIRLPDTGDCLTIESAERVAQAGYLLCQVARQTITNNSHACPSGVIVQLTLCWSLLRQILDHVSDFLGVDVQSMRSVIEGGKGQKVKTKNQAVKKERVESLLYAELRALYDTREEDFTDSAKSAAKFVKYILEQAEDAYPQGYEDAEGEIIVKSENPYDRNDITHIGFEKNAFDSKEDEGKTQYYWYAVKSFYSGVFDRVKNNVKDDMEIK